METIMKRALGALLLISACITINAAQAAAIDFRDGGWSGANNQSGHTSGGVSANAQKLFQTSLLGVGISTLSWWADGSEPPGFERLTIDLGAQRQVDSFILSNFFSGETSTLCGCTYDDQVFFRLDNGAWQSVTADDALTGLFDVTVAQSFREIELYSPYHEFSVQQILLAEVPEPAALMLLSLGLIGMGLRRRRKQLGQLL